MILSDSKILEEIDNKNIVIEPFDRECLGPNSYDVHLSPYLKVYDSCAICEEFLKNVGVSNSFINGNYITEQYYIDSKDKTLTYDLEIPEEGLILYPGVLYLGSTVEYTETLKHVPFLEGKSSIGRLGIFIHATAGRGDVGFKNYWTLELSVVQPVKIYPNMKIGQLIYHNVDGEVLNSYDKRKGSKYTVKDSKPQESKMYKNFKDEND